MKKLVFLAVLVAFIMAPMVMADDTSPVSFYGSVRFNTYVDSYNKQWGSLPVGTSSGNDINGYNGTTTSPNRSYSTLVWNSDWIDQRLGFNFKEGDITAKIEVRGSDGNVTVRHFWAAWNFGGGTLQIGRSWAPDVTGYSNENFLGEYYATNDFYGSNRENNIRLILPVGTGTLTIAFANPDTNTGYVNPAHSDDNLEWKSTMPKFEVAYDGKVNMVTLKIYGDYNQSQITGFTSPQTVDYTDKVDSYVVGATGQFDFSPFYFDLGIETGQNWQELGYMAAMGGVEPFSYGANGTDIQNTNYTKWGATIGFKVNDNFTLEGGYTKMTSDWKYSGVKETGDCSTWYVVAPINLAKNVIIYPEICQQEFNGDLNGIPYSWDGARESMYGVYWQINF